MYHLLFYLFVLVVVLVQMKDVPDLFTGTHELVNYEYPDYVSQTTVTIPFGNDTIYFENSYQHAVSIQYADRYSQGTQMQFSLKCREKPSNLNCSYIVDGFTWARLKFVYLVSIRNDFQCGHFEQVLSAPLFQTVPVFLSEPWTYSNDASLINFIPFISGANTSDENFGIQLINLEFYLTYQALLFDVNVDDFSSPNNTLKIQIYYILFQTDQNSDYFVEVLLDPTILPAQDDYMIGITTIKFVQIAAQLVLKSQNFNLGNNKSLVNASYNIISWVDSFTVSGLAIKDHFSLPLDPLSSFSNISLLASRDSSVGQAKCPIKSSQKLSFIQPYRWFNDRQQNFDQYIKENQFSLIKQAQRNLSQLSLYGVQSIKLNINPIQSNNSSNSSKNTTNTKNNSINTIPRNQFFISPKIETVNSSSSSKNSSLSTSNDKTVNVSINQIQKQKNDSNLTGQIILTGKSLDISNARIDFNSSRQQQLISSLQLLNNEQIKLVAKENFLGYTIQQKFLYTTRCIICLADQRYIPSKKACVPKNLSFSDLYPTIVKQLVRRPYSFLQRLTSPGILSVSKPITIIGPSPVIILK